MTFTPINYIQFIDFHNITPNNIHKVLLTVPIPIIIRYFGFELCMEFKKYNRKLIRPSLFDIDTFNQYRIHKNYLPVHKVTKESILEMIKLNITKSPFHINKWYRQIKTTIHFTLDRHVKIIVCEVLKTYTAPIGNISIHHITRDKWTRTDLNEKEKQKGNYYLRMFEGLQLFN